MTYTATDAKNNTATCSFAVIVTQQSSGGDVCTQPETRIIGSSNTINITGITTSSAFIQVFSSFWSPVYRQQVSTTSATVPNLVVGSYYVKVTVLGAGGRWPAVCEVLQNVTVTSGQNPCTTDVTPPTLASCPTNINLTTGTTTAIATWTAPTATDDCSTPSVNFTTRPTTGLTNGGAFPIGITTVAYTATDAKNNSTICAFNIIVTQSSACTTDNIPPVLTACPANMNLTTTTTSAAATWTAPTATDNCSTPSVSFTTSPTGLTNGGVFPIGTNTVTYTATDAKNNTATCRFTITVTQQTTGGDICAQPAANIVGTSNSIIISRITTASSYIQIFTSSWSVVYRQQTNTATVTIPNLPDGGYIVKVTVLGTGGKWPAICDIQQNVTVGSVLAAQSHAVLALEAHAEPTSSVLEWVNNTGYINDYFTVEKADNKTGIFEPLTIVNNKSLDKDMTHYVAYDKTPNEGDNSYRITLTHNNGSTKVSDIKTVEFKGLYSVRLFPNPANDVLTLDLSNYRNQNVEIYLFNYFGHLAFVKKIDKVSDALLDIPVSNIQTGNYRVRVQSKNRRAVTQSVIIAH